MPVIPSFGPAAARAFGFSLGGKRFVGSDGNTYAANPAQPIPWPAGTAAGDLGFVVVGNNSGVSSVSTSGWSVLSGQGTGSYIFWKSLVTADLTATTNLALPINLNNLQCYVFRGFTGANNLTYQGQGGNDSTTSRTWTGGTKSASCKGLFFLMNGNTSPNNMVITSPVLSGAAYNAGANLPGQYQSRALYTFYPSQYTNLTGVTESYGAFWNQLDFLLFEMV